MRLIDADSFDKVLSDAQDKCKKSGGNFRYGVLSAVRANMLKQPTVDAVPVRSTKAVVASSKDCNWYQCANCESPIDNGDRYCRGCGAEVVWDG